MDRALQDLRSEVHLLGCLAGRLAPRVKIADTLQRALDEGPEGGPDPEKLAEAKRAFYAMPEAHQRKILNGWRPVPHRPSVRGDAGDNELTRVLVIQPEAGEGGAPAYANEFALCRTWHPVTIIVAEGTTDDDLLEALSDARGLIESAWDRMIDEQPAPSALDDEPAQVWRALDFQRCHIGYLVTEAGNVDGLIAFVDLSDTSEQDAVQVARRIATDPRSAGAERCIDLRHYGKPDSTAPTPPWVYSLWCQTLDERGELIQPSPYCRFQRDRLNGQCARLAAEAETRTADRRSPTILSPGSRRTGRAASPTAA